MKLRNTVLQSSSIKAELNLIEVKHPLKKIALKIFLKSCFRFLCLHSTAKMKASAYGVNQHVNTAKLSGLHQIETLFQ